MNKLKKSGPLGKLFIIILLGPKAMIVIVAVYLKKIFAAKSVEAATYGTSAIV